MYKKRLWKAIAAGTLALTMLVTPIGTGSAVSAEEPETAKAPEINAAVGDIPLDTEHFPDANFRNWISANVDDGDNILSQVERDACTSISITNAAVADMTGIEYFTELTKLDCTWNALTALDVSGNTKLTKLNCSYNNDLVTLNISMNTELTELKCACDGLTALNVSANTKLEQLTCNTNKLTALNVSANTKLQQLICYNNSIATLDLSSNDELQTLDCRNNVLTSLNLNGATALISADCKYNRLTNLDVSTNTSLSTLICSNNVYYAQLNASRQYNVSNLSGFDVSKVSDVRGGTLSGTTLTFHADSDEVSYLYACGGIWNVRLYIHEKKMATGVTLNQSSATVLKGNTLQLTATVAPSDVTDDTVEWTSSNAGIATVSADGLVTARANGTATITCTAKDGSGKSADCVVTVKTLATGVTLNQSSATVLKGNTLQLTATVAPSDVTDDTVEWTSSNAGIATVSADGLVTARANGTATITCTAKDGSGKSADCVVTVKTLATGVTLNQSSATVLKGNTLQLTATVAPSDVTDNTVEWTSSNAGIATVSADGLITARANGTATITCTAKDGSGKSATCKITVCTNTEAFVTHLYAKALNRTPDAEGLNYWMKEINSGRRTSLQVAESFFLAPEFVNKNLNNTEYVKRLYRTFAGREYDQRGLDYWVARLNKGESRISVLESFADCQECREELRTLHD